MSLGKLEAVASKLKDSQEAAARELVAAQTKAREDAAALEKAKEKAAHFRWVQFYTLRIDEFALYTQAKDLIWRQHASEFRVSLWGGHHTREYCSSSIGPTCDLRH